MLAKLDWVFPKTRFWALFRRNISIKRIWIAELYEAMKDMAVRTKTVALEIIAEPITMNNKHKCLHCGRIKAGMQVYIVLQTDII